MAWTPGSVSALKKLYASYWSNEAIAIVLGQTRMAVRNKIKRLRRRDVDLQIARLRRALWRADGRAFISAEQAHEVLTQDGVKDGLRRLIARP